MISKLACRRMAALFVLTFALALRAQAAPEKGKRVWPIPDWAVSTPEAEGMSSEKLEALKTYFETHKSRAALVIRHGKIVAEWYWDGKDKDSTFQAYSVTKSLSSTAIGLLVKDGKVKLEQSASDFIPEWKSDDRKEITVRHLISMDSGLANQDGGIFMHNEQLKLSVALPAAHKPATVWNYNNGACNTLSQIITKAAGKEMGEFLEQRLYKPLGITHAKMDRNSDQTLAYMGLNINARDLAKVGYLFLNKGQWKGKRILPECWILQATTASQELNKAYGFLWWVRTYTENPKLPKDSYQAIGLYGNYLSVMPSQDLIVVRLIGTAMNLANSDVDGDAFAQMALDAIKEPAP